jgi:hypothetical protein
MRNPTVFTAAEIANWHIAEEYEPGKWRPARCCPFYGLRIKERLKAAWKVFTGEWDALTWGEKSGEWSNDQVKYRDCMEPNFIRTGKEP